MKKIALEEALTAPGLERYLDRTLETVTDPRNRTALTDLLEDRSNSRLATMDAAAVTELERRKRLAERDGQMRDTGRDAAQLVFEDSHSLCALKSTAVAAIYHSLAL